MRSHLYHSRQAVRLNDLQPEQIEIYDIAHALCIIPRWAGNSSRPYSVAEHSLMVMQMVEESGLGPEEMLQALLHDATEMFTGDIPEPVKQAVPEIKDFEKKVLWPPIADRFGLDHEMHPTVKRCDRIALFVEAKCLRVSDRLDEWEGYEEYMPQAEAWIEAWGEVEESEMPHPGMMMKVFLDCFNTLMEARQEMAS